jgi:hypothetical protein
LAEIVVQNDGFCVVIAALLMGVIVAVRGTLFRVEFFATF